MFFLLLGRKQSGFFSYENSRSILLRNKAKDIYFDYALEITAVVLILTYMRRKKTIVIISLVILAIAGFYLWKRGSRSGGNEIQYVTSTAEKGMLTSSISATGNVYVDQLSTVDPTITGTVSGLSVNVGDKVEKGQLLFSIINEDLSLNVAKAEASYQQALDSLESEKVSKDEAEANYEAAKKKDKADDSSYTSEQLDVLDDKIDLAKDQVDQAQTNVDNALLSLQIEKENAAKRKVTAPISGTVNEVNIKNGDDLSRLSSSGSSSSAPIIIGDLNTLKASVTVNEVDISKVEVGQKVMLGLDALDSATVTGKVEKVDSLGTVDQGVVSYNVIIDFDNLDEKIKPQMTVSASIITDVKQNVLIVPSGAVKTGNGSSYVEVLNGDTPEQKIVEVGISNAAETEIVSGLNEGDKVITQTIDPNSSTAVQGASVNGGIRIPGVSGGGGFRH